jgi:hypothetical protein
VMGFVSFPESVIPTRTSPGLSKCPKLSPDLQSQLLPMVPYRAFLFQINFFFSLTSSTANGIVGGCVESVL